MRLLEPVLFRAGRPVPSLPSLAGLEGGECARAIAAHSGHFALHERCRDGSHVLARDLLGVHKLFFAIDGDGVESANYLVELLRAGHPLERIFSVPAGYCLRLHPGERRYELRRWGALEFGTCTGERTRRSERARLAASIRSALESTFCMLAERYAGHPVYVTLSGGLDSTTIAALAREHFPRLCAVTFALREPREAGPGADLFFARRVATDLGIPHTEVLARPDEVLALLDEVLVYGQDYRDFNVHCGLVNAALGKALRARHPAGPRPIVLSGDVMNELMADYSPVKYRGREYFGLPRLDRGLIRRFLVGGLDAGDREVGIFARRGVETVQPYALCAREYAALPADMIRASGAKAELVRAVMGTRIPPYVLARPKVRAQVAVEGEPGGTLALLVDRGFDQARLKARFARLLGLEAPAVRDLMRAGHHRFATSFAAASAPPLRATRQLSGT